MQGNWLYPCEESTEEIPGYKAGYVQHYLIGQNPFLKNFSNQKHLPYDATQGGAKTMYPEYQLNLKAAPPSAAR
jgi:hypothetical protein